MKADMGELSRTKYYSFSDFSERRYQSGFAGKEATQLMAMYETSHQKKNPTILELGTQKGKSTALFLQACDETDGRLVSVDIDDCSDVAVSPRWQFVQSDSTNVSHILEQAPYLADGIDILYADSLHKREHVEREVMGWYPYMNREAWIFLDDVDSNPYRQGHRKDNYGNELDWDAIETFIREFFYANEDELFLSISYGSTGLASLYKTSERGTIPKSARPIRRRHHNAFAMMRHQPSLLKSHLQERWGRGWRSLFREGSSSQHR
ncbi:MAG: class I SAM-dependent methyltransferase [Cyanobacteria bacterium J06648_11]